MGIVLHCAVSEKAPVTNPVFLPYTLLVGQPVVLERSNLFSKLRRGGEGVVVKASEV